MTMRNVYFRNSDELVAEDYREAFAVLVPALAAKAAAAATDRLFEGGATPDAYQVLRAVEPVLHGFGIETMYIDDDDANEGTTLVVHF